MGDGLLTEHQRDLLAAAIERGCYHTPREITLTDLADVVDAAPSTVSETLPRVEGVILAGYAAENFDSDNSTRVPCRTRTIGPGTWPSKVRERNVLASSIWATTS